MKEQLEQYLLEAVEALKTGAEWVGGEIPLLIQEILIFNGVWAGVLVLIGLVGFTLVCVTVKRMYHEASEKRDDELLFLAIVVGVIGGIITVVITLMNLHTVLQIVLAPRLYLLEYAGRLLGGN